MEVFIVWTHSPKQETKSTASFQSSLSSRKLHPSSALPPSVMQLQKTIDNRVITQFLHEQEQASDAFNHSQNTIQMKANETGLPDQLKSGLENLSGVDLSDVKVHYNSLYPEKIGALAYAQGNEIHLGPGQEKHLPHEGWHVVQQKQGRVKPTLQMKGTAINDNSELEKEADVMGRKATHSSDTEQSQMIKKFLSQSMTRRKDTKTDKFTKDSDLSNHVQKRTDPIQRIIRKKDGGNIWAGEIARRLVDEENENIKDKIHRLHSIRTSIFVESYDDLVKRINNGEFDSFIEQSKKESPQVDKYEPMKQKISYPVVPKTEEDPRRRINVMIRMFNDDLRENKKMDKGLYHEIQTAIQLVREWKITHGRQISRSLTTSEKSERRLGNEQMILTPIMDDKFRELDMVFEKDGVPTIVEAKNKKTADTSQVEINRELAKDISGRVMYSLPKAYQEEAIRSKYISDSEVDTLPPLDILIVDSEKFGELYAHGFVCGLSYLPPLEALLDESFNPDSGDYHESEEYY